MNRKFNCLKLIVFFFSILISVSSYAASVNVTIKFYTGSSDSGGEQVGSGNFTYDPNISVCVPVITGGSCDLTPIEIENGFPGGTSYNGAVSDFSANFFPYSVSTLSFEKYPGFSYGYNLMQPAWFDPSEESMGFSRFIDSGDQANFYWYLLGEDSGFGRPLGTDIEMSYTGNSTGHWGFLAGSEGGHFTLMTPIPATIWLFASGFIGLIRFRRKR